jgi:hypothetical protein
MLVQSSIFNQIGALSRNKDASLRRAWQGYAEWPVEIAE